MEKVLSEIQAYAMFFKLKIIGKRHLVAFIHFFKDLTVRACLNESNYKSEMHYKK